MTTKIVTTTIRPNSETPWYYETPAAATDEEFNNLSLLMSEQVNLGNITVDLSYPDDFTFVLTLTLINEAEYLAANNVSTVEELLNTSPASVIAYNTDKGITESSIVEIV